MRVLPEDGDFFVGGGGGGGLEDLNGVAFFEEVAAYPDAFAVDEDLLVVDPGLGLFFGDVLLFGDDGEEALAFLTGFDGEGGGLH